MPLIHSSSKDAFSKNVAAERRAGKPQDQALAIAYRIKRERRAAGGKVHVGAIDTATDGRADKHDMEVPDGSYVLTADHCSSLGEGNTLSGFQKLDKIFPMSAQLRRAGANYKNGGGVPIKAAGGEYVICPEDIKNRWGDLDFGHRVLDAWQTANREHHIKTLASLPPPAQD